MKAMGHYENYCKHCDRQFRDANCLRMVRYLRIAISIQLLTLRKHLNSRIHRGSTIACPFCSVKYATASGLSHHLESEALGFMKFEGVLRSLTGVIHGNKMISF